MAKVLNKYHKKSTPAPSPHSSPALAVSSANSTHPKPTHQAQIVANATTVKPQVAHSKPQVLHLSNVTKTPAPEIEKAIPQLAEDQEKPELSLKQFEMVQDLGD
jgi:hypothetical protein